MKNRPIVRKKYKKVLNSIDARDRKEIERTVNLFKEIIDETKANEGWHRDGKSLEEAIEMLVEQVFEAGFVDGLYYDGDY